MSLIAAILGIVCTLIAISLAEKAGKLHGQGLSKDHPKVEDMALSSGGFLFASLILQLVAAWL